MDGKEDHREIIESLKSVARSSPESGEVEAASATSVSRELGEKFLCPVCETLVAADATVCPACGAEFSEGESTEYECPVCKASVPADADVCPNCGVRFAEETVSAEAAPAIARPRAAPPEIQEPARPTATRIVSAPIPPARPSRSALQGRLDALRDARKEAASNASSKKSERPRERRAQTPSPPVSSKRSVAWRRATTTAPGTSTKAS